MATSFKTLAQAAPNATADTTLYTVPAATQSVISTITVANRSGVTANYRIAVRPSGATLEDKNYVAYDTVVTGNDTIALTLGICLNATDVITVRASTGNLSFNAFGSEIS